MTENIGSGPIQVQDPSSPTGWSAIDTSLAHEKGEVAPESTDADISFSDGGTGDLASIGTEDASLSIGSTDALPAPTLDGNQAIYPDVAPNTDLVLEARPTGFEQTYVISEPPTEPLILDVPLTLSGLTPTLEGGSLVLTDESGQVVGGSDPALMWDASFDPDTGEPRLLAPIPTTLVEKDGVPTLELTPDPSFFDTPGLQWPITIDPTVSLSISVDTYVQNQNPSGGFPGSAVLKVGTVDAGATITRTLISFTSASTSGVHVLSASLQLFESFTPTCTATQADLYSVTSDFTSAVNWSTQPGIGSLYASTTAALGKPGCPAGNVTFDTGGAGGSTLRDLVQAWADGTAIRAVEIRAHSETDSNGAKSFSSSEAGTNVPVLSVTFNHYPSVPTGLKVTTSGGIAPSVMHGSFFDADGGNGQVAYEIYDDHGLLVAAGTGSMVTSGSDSPYTVPTGALLDGVAYTWKARSFDGTDYSAYSSVLPFEPDQLHLDPFVFDANSFWNQRHDLDPISPNTTAYMTDLQAQVCPAHCYLSLSGTTDDKWGTPYYDGTSQPAKQTVRCVDPNNNCYGFPGSLTFDLRLPPDTSPTYPTFNPSNDSDSYMVVVDRNSDAGYAVWLHRACPPGPYGTGYCAANTNTDWTADGMSIHYLASDGLDGCWPSNYQLDFPVPPSDLRNKGHRGMPGSYLSVRWREVVRLGAINHVLKIAIPNPAPKHFFPYSGHEQRTGTIPEGTLIRIKSSVNLDSPTYNLQGPALIMAKAIQKYGAVIGDTSSSQNPGANLKVENLKAEGYGQSWIDFGITETSLSSLPLDSYEFAAGGYWQPRTPDPPQNLCQEEDPEI